MGDPFGSISGRSLVECGDVAGVGAGLDDAPMRRGVSTETMSSSPVTIDWISVATSLSMSRLRSRPMSSTPAITPPSVPLPPSKSTPPSSTAAMTASSMPMPLSARALPYRRVKTTPAKAATVPDSTNSTQLDPLDPDARRRRRPRSCAPMANSDRPSPVACRTTR